MSDFEVVKQGNPLYAEIERLKRERDELADALRDADNIVDRLPAVEVNLNWQLWQFKHAPILAQVRK